MKGKMEKWLKEEEEASIELTKRLRFPGWKSELQAVQQGTWVKQDTRHIYCAVARALEEFAKGERVGQQMKILDRQNNE